MKLYNKLIFSICLSSVVLFCQAQDNAYSLMKDANELYKNAKFDQAAMKYELVVKSDSVSTDLYYNLGNSYFRLNDIPRAILNYERALIIDPSNEDAKFNLDKANLLIQDKVKNNTTFISNKYNQLLSLQSVDSWAWGSVILFLVFLIFLSIYLFANKMVLRKLGFYIASFCFILALFFFTFAYSANDRFIKQKYAIIVEPSTTLLSAPTITGKELSVLHQGIKVKVLDSDVNWYKVKLSDDSEGWLKRETIEII